MSTIAIIEQWKKNVFKPIYFIHGEEDFYIDVLMNYAEQHLLTPEEAAFNLTIFYGKDAEKPVVENACKRYPMFADKQVVLLKEAQFMKDLDKLETYITQPLASTILVIGYKGKKYDKRLKFFKTLSTHAEIFLSEKIKDDKLPAWIANLVKQKGLAITPKAAALLEQHIGNDLSRISNEIDKLAINLKANQQIDVEEIEKFIGISKEYNIFELGNAIAYKDFEKAFSILQYFESNPKAAPPLMALPALYSSFSKVYAAFGAASSNDKDLFALLGYYGVQPGKAMMKNYGRLGVEKILLLLHQYNLKSIGIGESYNNNSHLLKEMVTKMML